MLVTLNSPKGKKLREKCEPVTDPSVQVEPYLEEAKAIMAKHDGIGLAAPQMGVQYQWFIDKDEQLFINPEISKYERPISVVEGCLSLPGHWYDVPRYDLVELAASDATMQRWKMTYSGMEALIMQHELDHLNGRLISDIGTRVYT